MSYDFKQVRGIRNNNPFNIRKSSCRWQGKIKGSDPDFEVFDTMPHGLRAGLVLLTNYIRKDVNTPRKIIERFAPSHENNTNAYLDYIIRNHAGIRFIRPDEVVSSVRLLTLIASRMIKFECCLSQFELANMHFCPKDLEIIISNFNININPLDY